MLAVDAPPATEKNEAFCHVARLFRQYGIHAPQVFAVDKENGFMLVEDLGSVMYWPLLQQSQQRQAKDHETLYRDATRCLISMAAIPVQEAGLPTYDREKLQQEMDLFPRWFVNDLLQIKLTDRELGVLRQLNNQLIVSALEQPQVVVHRDFHCRNLMRVENQNPGVIDFQDAVIGPCTYDLVSLYRDCYIRWPSAQVTAWVQEYYQQCVNAGMLVGVEREKFLRWFDWMGLQRHIKVLGIFARLFLRDQKAGYLRDLPLVMHYTLTVAKQYPEYSDFCEWFERELLPRAKRCDWYQDIRS